MLGHFSVTIDGEPQSLAHSESRLLALLCIQPTDVSREWAAGALWPDVSTATSLRRLRSTMSCLNQTLPGAIHSCRDSIGVAAGIDVDIRIAWSHARLVSSWSTQAVQLELRPELFAHDLLADWYEEWIDADRESFRNTRIHVLEQTARQLLSKGQFGAAIDACLRVLRCEPYRETAHRLLVDIYVTEGNRTKAVDHARQYEEVLRSELGLEPTLSWGL